MIDWWQLGSSRDALVGRGGAMRNCPTLSTHASATVGTRSSNFHLFRAYLSYVESITRYSTFVQWYSNEWKLLRSHCLVSRMVQFFVTVIVPCWRYRLPLIVVRRRDWGNGIGRLWSWNWIYYWRRICVLPTLVNV